MPVNPPSPGGSGLVPFRLFRVDDRLLHGQVSLGWGRHLGKTDYVLADEVLGDDPDSAALYDLAAPTGATVSVVSPGHLIDALDLSQPHEISDEQTAEQRAGRDRDPRLVVQPLLDPSQTVLLVRGIRQAAMLLRAGVPGPVNLGGLHMRSGAIEILPYLFLTLDDRDLLRRLVGEDHSFFAQELPGYPSVDGRDLVEHPAWGGES